VKKFWNFSNNEGEAELLLYGTIGEDEYWDDVTAKGFNDDLKSLGNIGKLTVRINSGGGSVFAGMAIYTSLKRFGAKIVVKIDGLAASMASVIAMAGDEVHMPKSAMFMVHNPWTYARGDSNDLRDVADVMDKLREVMLAAYIEKSGMDKQELIALLDAETWLTAEEALEHGFISEIEDFKVEASVSGHLLHVSGNDFDMSKFNNFQGSKFNLQSNLNNKNGGKKMTEKELQAMRETLSEEQKAMLGRFEETFQGNVDGLAGKVEAFTAELSGFDGKQSDMDKKMNEFVADFKADIVATKKDLIKEIKISSLSVAAGNDVLSQFNAKFTEKFKLASLTGHAEKGLNLQLGLAAPGSDTVPETQKIKYADNMIIRALDQSPLWNLIRKDDISNSSGAKYPRLAKGFVGAGWIAERAERVETEGLDVESVTIEAFGYYRNFPITNELLMRDSYDYAKLMQDNFSSKLIYDVGGAILFGTGVNQPFGILNNAEVLTYAILIDETGSNEVIDLDTISDAFAELASANLMNAVSTMHRKTYNYFRKLKDSQGNYLLGTPNTRDFSNPMLDGKKVVLDDNMPIYTGLESASVGDRPVLIGDYTGYQGTFTAGYNIKLIDQITNKGFSNFYDETYIGGDVLVPEKFVPIEIE
jgi:ATP-dependent Clp protease protease subunit